MPVEVEAPDGSVVEFPDGTSPQTMRDAMRRRYGGSPGYNRARRQQQRRVEAPRIPGVSDFNQFVDQIPRNLGVADELAAVGSGALQGVTNLARRATGQPVQTTMQEAGQAASDFQIAERERYRRENPAGDALSMVAGIPLAMGTAPAAAPTGFLSTAAAGRGMPAWLAQTAQGLGTGTIFGAGFGALNADGGAQERVQGAQRGAEVGAILGGVTPTAINAARPVIQAGANAAGNLFGRVRVDPSRVGSMGGNVTLAPPAPPPMIPREAAGTIDRMAGRAGLSAAEVERRLAAARANPQGEVLADVFGDPGVRTLRPIAQSPGRTGERAAEVARQRFQGAPERITGELRTRLGVAETPQAALRSLEAQYERASADLYNPLWANPTTVEQRALFAARIEPLLDDPVMQDAMRRATDIFRREVRLGRMSGGIEDNLARYLHFVKMGMDDAIGAASRNPTGIQSTEMRGVRELRNRFVQALDPGDGSPAIIPGYAQARSQWGGLREAEEALDEGAKFLNMNASEVAQTMQGMTPFARYHARVGLAEAVAERIGLRGSVNANRNVAESLGSPEMQARVRAAFDNPEQAAAFLDTLNVQNMLMRNAGQWGSGSTTFSNAAYGADEAAHAMADAAGSAATGNAGNAISSGVRGAIRSVTGGLIERANDTRGAALLTRVDNGDSEAFARAIVEELRRREAARAASAAGARSGAAASGTQAGRRRN